MITSGVSKRPFTFLRRLHTDVRLLCARIVSLDWRSKLLSDLRMTDLYSLRLRGSSRAKRQD